MQHVACAADEYFLHDFQDSASNNNRAGFGPANSALVHKAKKKHDIGYKRHFAEMAVTSRGTSRYGRPVDCDGHWSHKTIIDPINNHRHGHPCGCYSHPPPSCPSSPYSSSSSSLSSSSTITTIGPSSSVWRRPPGIVLSFAIMIRRFVAIIRRADNHMNISAAVCAQRYALRLGLAGAMKILFVRSVPEWRGKSSYSKLRYGASVSHSLIMSRVTREFVKVGELLRKGQSTWCEKIEGVVATCRTVFANLLCGLSSPL